MLILADSGSVRQIVFTSPGGFRWIDVAAPDRPTLDALTSEFSLPEAAAEDCLDTHQLPRIERHDAYTFVMLRLHSGATTSSSASAYELTQPLAVFVGSDLLLTMHRRDHPLVARLRKAYADVGPGLEQPAGTVLDDLISGSLLTYEQPLNELTNDLVQFETRLLGRRLTESALEQIFLRKRRASALAWVLQRTRDALTRAHLPAAASASNLQEPRETADAMHFRAREVMEFTDNLLNLQIAVASHRTNEVMRLLTVMSVIFMPLTFIVGVYGMNFEAQPEFKWRYGYFGVWVVIVAVFFGILNWFRRRGLLG